MKKRASLTIGLLVNPGKPLAAKVVPGLVNWLRHEGHRPLVANKLDWNLAPGAERCSPSKLAVRSDLVVALGGDGTLLRAARLVGRRETPIMGVNLGGLGFLTEFAIAEARAGVTALSRGTHTEERRIVLSCSYGSRRGHALNDVSVNMGPSNRVIDITARAAGKLITKYVGDGLIVATPTGSTAYSLAAGGPVVYPTMSAILLTPICPHALGSRPLILPGDTTVVLDLGWRSVSAILSLDGQERWTIKPDKPVIISGATFAVRLVTPRGKTCFRILRDKLNWTGSQR